MDAEVGVHTVDTCNYDFKPSATSVAKLSAYVKGAYRYRGNTLKKSRYRPTIIHIANRSTCMSFPTNANLGRA